MFGKLCNYSEYSQLSSALQSRESQITWFCTEVKGNSSPRSITNSRRQWQWWGKEDTEEVSPGHMDFIRQRKIPFLAPFFSTLPWKWSLTPHFSDWALPSYPPNSNDLQTPSELGLRDLASSPAEWHLSFLFRTSSLGLSHFTLCDLHFLC